MWRWLVLLAAACAVAWLLARCDGPAAPTRDLVAKDSRGAVAPASAPGGAPANESGDRTAVELPAAAPADAGPKFLRGVVVDEHGLPVAGATVAAHDDSWGGHCVQTDELGRFEVDREPAHRASHVRVTCGAEGHDQFEDWLPWGSEDLRIVLGPAVPVAVTVVDAAGHAVPVEGVSLSTYDFRAAGEQHELQLERGAWRTAACRGEWTLRVALRPEDANVVWTPPPLQRLAIGAPVPVQVEVVVAPARLRVVAVLDPEGAPVSGARVSVIDARGLPLRVETRVYDTPTYFTDDEPLELGHAMTDDTGRVRLAAPADRPLVVRARRDGFLPVQCDVGPAEERPLVLELPRGAHADGLLLVEPWLQDVLAGGNLGVRLSRSRDGRPWDLVWPEEEPVRVGHDGRFAIRGAPPGPWDVAVHVLEGPGNAEGGVLRVELRSGANPTLVVDVRGRWTSEVHGRVLLDGRPHAGPAALVASPVTAIPEGAGVLCDEQGRFSCRVRPGTYRMLLGGFGTGEPSWWSADVECAAGRVEPTIRLEIGTVLLTFVDRGGEPARGRWIQFLERVPAWAARGWETDGDGTVLARLAVGETIVAQPVHAHRYVPTDLLLETRAKEHVVLGTVTVRAGETTRATFVLPPEPR